jgi:uncharacterized protein (DUF1697 family)
MPRFAGFLRAVNLAGKRKVAMAQLREECEGLGFDDVSTYINSGNVLFSATGKGPDLEPRIEQRLHKVFGFEIETFVRTAKEVEHAIALQPFGRVTDTQTHMVLFLRGKPTAAVRTAVEALSNDVDRLVVDGREVHQLIAGKIMDSTLKAKHWKCLGDQPTTARNTTMLRKLAEKL